MWRKQQRKKPSINNDTKITRPDTGHKMRLVCVLFTFENNAGPTDLRTDRRTDTVQAIEKCFDVIRNSMYKLLVEND